VVHVQGEHAHRIWSAIYSQNCFKDVHSDTCDEESLVFYRIISGVHASISMHLVHDYLLDESTGTWGPNLPEFRTRFTRERCSHVQNLYFVYLFVLRAVAKAAPALHAVKFHTGIPNEDAATQVLALDCVFVP
jgi:ERO1-like protein alpha